MNTTAIIFFVSLIGILGMIFLKYREIKKERKSWLARLVLRFDPFFSTVYGRVRLFISYFNRKSAAALVQLIAYHVLSVARSIYLWIRAKAHAHPPSKKVIDMVRGRTDTSLNNGASFYLKKISQEK